MIAQGDAEIPLNRLSSFWGPALFFLSLKQHSGPVGLYSYRPHQLLPGASFDTGQ